MPQNLIEEGRGTNPWTLAGWQSRDSSASACPSAEVIWSMMPHGAPTTKFSAIWQSLASSVPSSVESDQPGDRLHRCDLERRGGAYPFALGHFRFDNDPQTASELKSSLALEDKQHAHHVGRPVQRRFAGEPAPGGIVVTLEELSHRCRIQLERACLVAILGGQAKQLQSRLRARLARLPAWPHGSAIAGPESPSNRQCPPSRRAAREPGPPRAVHPA